MVTNKLDEKAVREQADSLSFPSSVVEFFQGAIGIPYGGFPEPMRTQAPQPENAPKQNSPASMEQPRRLPESLRAQVPPPHPRASPHKL